MAWNHDGANKVSFSGNMIFKKGKSFEDFWSISFSDRYNVTSAYAENVTATNTPIIFTNVSDSTNIGTINIYILDDTTGTKKPVGSNFVWSSSGVNVNVAANSTYSYQGISHTSIKNEFYYDGISHGVPPYSGTLNGAHSYEIQFVYTETATGRKYYSNRYPYGSQCYYYPITDISQWIRGDLYLVFTASLTNEPWGGYALGDTVTGTLTICNTNPFAASIGISAPSGVTLAQAQFDNISSGATVQTTFTYTIIQADILNGSKSFEFGAGIPGTGSSMNPITKDGITWGCTAFTESPNPYMCLTLTNTNSPDNGDEYVLGEIIEYTLSITNGGNLTIDNLDIWIEATEDRWNNLLPLYPGETRIIDTGITYEVGEEDILRLPYAHSYIKAEGTGTCAWLDDPDVVADPADDEEPVEAPNSEITITIETDTTENPPSGPQGCYDLEDIIDYNILVENTGNLGLTNLTVEDKLTGDSWAIEETLYPGESKSYIASYTVAEYNILEGEVINQVRVWGNSPDPDNPDVDFTSDEYAEQTVDPYPHLTLQLEPVNSPINGNAYVVGEQIRWKITLTNDGNLTLHNITIDNPLTLEYWDTYQGYSISLGPGLSRNWTTNYYTITAADAASEEVVNETTVTWESEDPETPTGSVVEDDAESVLPQYTLTIYSYLEDLNGNYVLDSSRTHVYTYNAGAWYNRTTDTILGFTADKARVYGTLNSDYTEDVYYDRNVWTNTISYRNANTTTELYPSITDTVKYGASYYYTAEPAPSGFQLAGNAVYSGSQPNRGQTFVFVYIPDAPPIVIDDYSI